MIAPCLGRRALGMERADVGAGEDEDELRAERGTCQRGRGTTGGAPGADVADVAGSIGGGELGVSVRTVWRWLEVAESEDRLGCKPRSSFTVYEDDLVELAYYRGNVSALREARIAEGRPTPSVGAFRAAFARALPPGRRAGLKLVNESAVTSTPTWRGPRVAGVTSAGRPITRSWLCADTPGRAA